MKGDTEVHTDKGEETDGQAARVGLREQSGLCWGSFVRSLRFHR